MHVFPATANDCILQTNSFGLVNRHIFRPTDKNGTALHNVTKLQYIARCVPTKFYVLLPKLPFIPSLTFLKYHMIPMNRSHTM